MGDFNKTRAWYRQQLGETVKKALERRGFKAYYFNTAQEAKNNVLELIPAGASIGVGGSVTIREMGLVEELRARGHEVHDHWVSGITPEEDWEIRRRQLTCDVFLTGCNAITIDGRLLNTDFTGNRVAAMIFGPRRIIMVAGINKIVKDIQAGLERIKNVATPLNSHRRNWGKACAKAGYCIECDLEDKSCRVTTIIEMCPKGSPDFHVILVGEELGY